MSPQKKRKPHRCKNHIKRIARGRCVKCGTWICRECAVLTRGQFRCKHTCQLEQYLPSGEYSSLKSKHRSKPEMHSIKTYKRLVLIWSAGIIVFLGILTLTLYALNVHINLQKQNAILTNKLELCSESRSNLVLKYNSLKNNSVKKQSKENVDIYAAPEDKAVDPVNTGKQKEEFIEKQRAIHYMQDRLPYTFNNGTTGKKFISLTFDGGSYSNCTNNILDTLKSRKINATMFLTAYYIKQNKELVRRMITEGHEIGNHTATHPHLTTWAKNNRHNTLPEITEALICSELDKTNMMLKKIAHLNVSSLWRAPYGETNDEINKWAQNCGYLHIGWKQARRWKDNYDTNDWVPNPETPGYRTPQQVIDKFAALSEKRPYGMNGAIILMHLGTLRKREDHRIHKILGKIIDSLQKKGYEFVTVSVLLKESNVPLHLL